MKKDLHPINYPVIFADTSCGVEFITTSTQKSDETRDIDGVTYYVINLEISSASHPFYTGKQILVDTARRVEKFDARASKQQSAADVRKGKKVKKAKVAAEKQAEADKEKTEA